MSKGKRAQYTLEFKIEAVRLVRSGQSVAAVSATLGVSDQTLHMREKRLNHILYSSGRRARSVANSGSSQGKL